MLNHELSHIQNLYRIENFPPHEMETLVVEKTHSVYPHDQVYGQFITVEEYVNCPPVKAFAYLSDGYNLAEWTYSTRKFKPDPDHADQIVGIDGIGRSTQLFVKVIANAESGTVDFHCAWDQGDVLWMVYLMRVIPAQLVVNKPGCVITWTNCRHPYYEANPFPEKSPPKRQEWVGDFWPLFYAGHWVEMQNLKAILESRCNASG